MTSKYRDKGFGAPYDRDQLNDHGPVYGMQYTGYTAIIIQNETLNVAFVSIKSRGPIVSIDVTP